MKKLFLLATILFLSITLSACAEVGDYSSGDNSITNTVSTNKYPLSQKTISQIQDKKRQNYHY